MALEMGASGAKVIPSEKVYVDYRVRVRIFTEQKTNALVIPRSSLFRGPDNRWQVFAVQGRKAILQTVGIGLINDTHAEIVEGLTEGQSVILAPDTKLVHGKRVKPIAPGRQRAA